MGIVPELVKIIGCLQHSALVKVHDDMFEKYGVEVWLKRDDLIHPVISGNKWRKLKYNLNQALALKKQSIISMGGQYSNHIHALAYAGYLLRLKTYGLIRGEPRTPLTPTLQDALRWGMRICYVSRTEYRILREGENYEKYLQHMPNSFWLPEGGVSELALQGIAELVDEIKMEYDVICVACGTGTTLAGIARAVPRHVSVLGIAVLKHAEFLNSQVTALLGEGFSNWEINVNYHLGGYAKINPALRQFIQEFQNKNGIVLDCVYTGKMMYALYGLIEAGYFKPGQRIIAIHTGGLQGNRGDNNAASSGTRIDGR